MLDAHALAALCGQCGLSIDRLTELARDYGTAKPAAILLGWGLNKYR